MRPCDSHIAVLKRATFYVTRGIFGLLCETFMLLYFSVPAGWQ